VSFELVKEHAKSLSTELTVAIEAARLAGDIVRAGYYQVEKGHSVEFEQKGVGDLVSDIDRDADLASTSWIREHSDYALLSEELNADVGERDNMWIVDPLDASSAFLVRAGVSYPAVLIALRQDATLTLGVCFFPLTGEWFYAQKGRGAWKDGKRLVCDSSDSLAEVWVEMNQYGSAEHETEYFKSLRQRLRSSEGARLVTSNVPHSGVAMRIAEGTSSLGAAVHDNNPVSVKQATWDIAAPQIILEEAGGVFLNPEGQRTNPFVCEPIIVARSHGIAQQIVDLGIAERVS